MTRTYTALLSMALVLGGFSVATADGFTTVLNVPPDSLDSLPLAEVGSSARIVPSGTQVNLTAFPSSTNDFTVLEGGELNYSAGGFTSLTANGGVINLLNGGEVSLLIGYLDGQVNVHGADVQETLALDDEARATISGGQVREIALLGRSSVLFEGGTLASYLGIFEDTEVTITGGDLFVGNGRTGILGVEDNGILNISGGNIHFENADFVTFAVGAQVNFSGYDFAIDGVLIPGLALGDPLQVFDRDVTLSGRLTDGSPFSLVLGSQGQPYVAYAPGAVTVTYAIPEPGAFLLALLGMAGAASGRVGRRG